MFNVNDQEQSLSFEPLAPGFYKFYITGAQLKERDNGSQYFEFILETDDGNKVWHRTMWVHPNSTAQRIGKEQLADLLAAIGVESFTSVEDLQTKTISKELICQIAQEVYQGKINTKVSSCWSVDGAHRNPKRTLSEIKLGPDLSSKMVVQKQDDVPF